MTIPDMVVDEAWTLWNLTMLGSLWIGPIPTANKQLLLPLCGAARVEVLALLEER